MEKPEPTNDDLHYDGVFIGAPVPMSVFYKRSKQLHLLSFKKPHYAASIMEAVKEREEERRHKAHIENMRAKRAKRPGFTGPRLKRREI